MELEIIEVDHSMYPIFKMAIGWGEVGGVQTSPESIRMQEWNSFIYFIFNILIGFTSVTFFR